MAAENERLLQRRACLSTMHCGELKTSSILDVKFPKFWTIASKNGSKISLTPRDLQNNCFRILSTN